MTKETAGPELRLAGEAMAHYDWSRVHEILRPLLDDESADPGYLEMLADASWWVGKVDDSIAAGERAFGKYMGEGREVDAARVALLVAENYAHRLQSSSAQGWMMRARRSLEEAGTVSELGYLRRLESTLIAGAADGLSKALSLATEVQQIGTSLGDKDLEMLGLHDRGKFTVAGGDVEEGLAMMEEALACAVAGELSPKVTGRVLCNTIEVTASMGDYERATEWSDQAMRWCDSMGNAGGYPGACRVRRSEFMRLRGAWSAAEAEASRAAAELVDLGPYQAQAFNELGMIRLNTGDLDGAEDAFRRAHMLGASPMPGFALLALARDDNHEAWSMISSELADIENFLRRAKLIPSAIEIALTVDAVEDARRLASELDDIAARYDSTLLRIFALQAKGRIEAHEGRFGEAVGPLKSVVEQLTVFGVPYEAARARCDLGLVLIEMGSGALGELEIQAARAEFSRLGAALALQKLSGILAGDEPPTALPSLSTMMFTDIVDSTKLVGIIGDEAWADLISWHDRTIRNLFDKHGGTEIDHAGDGFFVTFRSPQDAADCAVEIQRVLRRHRKESGFSPRMRIGFHAGEVLQANGGLVGREVHSAARVAAAAEGDEVLVSEETAGALADVYRFDEERHVDAKGLNDPMAVRRLIWAE